MKSLYNPESFQQVICPSCLTSSYLSRIYAEYIKFDCDCQNYSLYINFSSLYRHWESLYFRDKIFGDVYVEHYLENGISSSSVSYNGYNCFKFPKYVFDLYDKDVKNKIRLKLKQLCAIS